MKWIYRLSFKKRIFASFIGLVLFSILTTGTASYLIASKVMENSSLELSQNNLNQTALVMDDKFRKLTVSMLTLTIHGDFLNIMKDASEGNRSRYYTHLSKIQLPFTQTMLNEPAIHSILLVTPVGDFYPIERQRSSISFTETPYYEQLKEKKSTLWISAHEDILFMDKQRVVSVISEPLTDPGLSVGEVYLVVNIYEQALDELITNQAKKDRAPYFIMSREGSMVALGEQAAPLDDTGMDELRRRIGQGTLSYFEIAAKDDMYLVNSAAVTIPKDWVLVSMKPKRELLRPIQWIGWATLFISVGCLLLAIMFSNAMTTLLLRPLLKLQTLMRQAGQSNLSVRYESPYQDELSQVGTKFNSMLSEISDLIEQVKHTEVEKRKAEMKALQAQIDPHFLYNSLNTVFWRCMSNQHDDAKEIVVALSKLFEIGLNKGAELTTLERELAHVAHYLDIQRKCYEGLFEYEIEADELLLRCDIVKILLQPLAENSILHGFSNMETGGRIRIEARKEGMQLRLSVTDNGKGMDAQSVSHMSREGSIQQKGYALRNVYQRILLYYGDEAKMTMESEPNLRTTISIYVPMQSNVPEHL